MKVHHFFFLAALTIGATPGSARAADVLIGETATPQKNTFPFGTDSLSAYQQIYSASAFQGPINIDQITFYQNASPGGVFMTANYEVELSTTSAAVGALSTTPSANFGTNNTVFFDGVLSGGVSSSFTLSSSIPFHYDPTQGNLLLTIYQTNVTGSYTEFSFDASTSTDFSRMYDRTDGTSGTDGTGLVTQFGAPEPQTWLLMTAGFVVVGCLRAAAQRSERTRACRLSSDVDDETPTDFAL